MAGSYLNDYTTELNPDEESQYQQYKTSLGDQGNDVPYDLRGYWKDNVLGKSEEDRKAGDHFTDKYKKPNHPTFSDESMYHGTDNGQGGVNAGGHWVDNNTFAPTDGTDTEKLQQYLDSPDGEKGRVKIFGKTDPLRDRMDPKVASFINEAYDKSNQWLAKTLDNVDAIPVPKTAIDKKGMREMAASYAVIQHLTGVEPVEAAKNLQLYRKGIAAQWGEDEPKTNADFLDQARRHINGSLNYGEALTKAFNQGVTDSEGGKMKDPVTAEQEWRTINGSLIASKGGSTPLDEKSIHEGFTFMYDRGAAIAMNPMFPLVKETYDFFKKGTTPEGTPKLDAVSDTMLEFDSTPSASESTLKSKIMGMTDEQQNQFFQTLGQYSLAKGDDKASIGQWFGELGQTLSRGIVETGNAIAEPPLRSLATSAGDLGVLLGNPELAQGAENDTRDLDVQARLKDAADNLVNPLHEYGFATDVARGVVGVVPWMAAFAVDPVLGIGAMGLSNIGNVQTVLRQNNPGMSQAELNGISVMVAAPMTALQSISMGSAFKAFPWLEQRIATTFGGGILNQIGHIGVTTAGMNLADATSILSQKVAQVFDPELKMGTPASDQLVDLMFRLPESAATFSIITLAGAGIHRLQGGKDAAQAKNTAVEVAKALRDEQALRAMGWSNEQIAEAQNAPLGEVLNTVIRINGEIRADAVKNGKEIATKGGILSRLNAESPETPTMIVLDDGTYRLMVPDSKGVLQSAGETPDFEVANSRLMRLESFYATKQLQHFNQLIDHMMGVWEKQGIENRTVETPSEPGKTVQDYLDHKESKLSEAELRLRVALAGGHENDSLSSSIIEGYTTNEWKNKVYTDIIRVLDHNPQTFLHESSDAHTNRAIAMGKFTHDDLVRWIRQTETGMKAIDGQDHQYLKPEFENNPAAIVEAHTQLFLDYAGGKFEAYKAAPSALKGFFKAMLRYFQNVLAKAKVLNAAIEAGTVPQEYHQHLAETMGLDIGERLAPEEGKETARLMGADVADGNLEQQTLFSIKPKESADDERMNPIRAALQQYEDGEKIQDFGDLVDHIDELAGETGNSDLDTALYDYRTAVEEDYKMYGGRGDAEEYEAQFLSDLAKASDNLDNEANGEPITHPDGTVSNPNETTEPGTPAPDTGISEIDPDQQEGDGWKDIPWTEDTNFSIKHLPTSFVWMSKKEYDKIAKRTDTIAGIHIDRMRVGEYLGIDLQGGMYYPTIVENLKKRVVWAFNSAGVARTVARRAAENGGYVKLILMQEGNVIGNKTFGNIWFEQLRRNIAAGSITEKKALEALNTIRDRYKTKKAIVDGTGDFVVKMVKDKETGKMVPEMVKNKKTGKMEKKMVRVKGTGEVYDKKYTGHMEEWKSLAEAQTAILAMTQTKRASTYFNKTKTNTKAKGEGISYGNLLSKKMTAMGLPDAAVIVEAIEEPSFKGVPKGASVAIIKFDAVADGDKILTGKQAGVTPHISYNYVLKGEPVARMRKFKVVDEEFPETKNRILTQAHTDFPLERSISFSIRKAEDIKRQVDGMSSDEIRGMLASAKLTPMKDMVAMLGQYPEYLKPVAQFIMDKRQALVDGKVTPRDVAKAYWMTLASIGSDSVNVETIKAKADKHGIPFNPTEMYMSQGRQGQLQMRPEELAAYWLGTPDGQKALDNIEQGKFDPQDWESGLLLRDAFGRNDLRAKNKKDGTSSSGAVGVPKEGKFNLQSLQEFTDAINASKGDPTKLEMAVKNAVGIGEGKKGFISHMFGFGGWSTIDAVEINTWLTGKGDTTYASEKDKTLVAAAKKASGSVALSRDLFQRIRDSITGLRTKAHGGKQIPEEVAAHIIHHWIWDAAKGIQTTHEGLYHSMINHSIRTKADADRVNAEFERQMVASPTKRREIIERAAARFGKVQDDMAKINEELASDMKHRREVNAATMQEKKAREIEDIELGEKQELRDALEKNKDKFSDQLLTAEGQKKISLEAQMKDRARLIEKGIKDKYAEKKKAMEQRYSEEDVTALSRADIRQEMQQNLVTLGAIMRTLPPEVRGTFGNPYTEYANKIGDKAKADYLVDIIQRMSHAIDSNLRESFIDKAYDLYKAGQPKKQSGKPTIGKITPEGHALLQKIYDLWHLDGAEVDSKISSLKHDLSVVNDNEKMSDSEKEAEKRRILQEIALTNLHGNFSPYRIEKSIEGTRKVPKGGDNPDKSAAESEQVVEHLKHVIDTGRAEVKDYKETRAAEVKARADALTKLILGHGGKATTTEVGEGKVQSRTWVAGIRKLMDMHFTNTQLVDHIFGQKEGDDFATRVYNAVNAEFDSNHRDEEMATRFLLDGIVGKDAPRGWKTERILKKALATLSSKKSTGIATRENLSLLSRKILIGDARSLSKKDWKGLDYDYEKLLFTLNRLDNNPNSRTESLDIREIDPASGDEVKDLKLSEFEAMQRLLLWRQSRYRRTLELSGMNADVASKLEAFVNKTTEGRIFYSFLRDHAYDNYDKLNGEFERQFGISMPRIENYASASGSWEINKDTDEADVLGDNNSGGASLTPGFAIERQNHVATLKDSNAWTNYMAHTRQVNYWLSHVQLNRDMQATYGSKQVIRALQSRGRNEAEQMSAILKNISKEDMTSRNIIRDAENIARAFASYGATSILGLNPKVAVKHLTSAVSSAMVLDPMEFLSSARNVATGQGVMPLTDAFNSEEVKRFVQASRGNMTHEGVSLADRNEKVQNLALAGQSLGEFAHSWIPNFMRLSNTATSAIVYDASFRSAKADGVSDTQAHQIAKDRVNAALHRVNPVGFSIDQPSLERRHPIMALIQRFAGPVRQGLGITMHELATLGRDVKAAPDGSKASTAINKLARAGAAWALPGLVEAALLQGMATLFGSQQEKEDANHLDEYLAAMLAGRLYGFFWVGSTLSMMAKSFITGKHTPTQDTLPLVQYGKELVRSGKKIFGGQGETEDYINAAKSGVDITAAALIAMHQYALANALGGVSATANLAKPVVNVARNVGVLPERNVAVKHRKGIIERMGM